jgi:hypothetical protein
MISTTYLMLLYKAYLQVIWFWSVAISMQLLDHLYEQTRGEIWETMLLDPVMGMGSVSCHFSHRMTSSPLTQCSGIVGATLKRGIQTTAEPASK